MQLNTIHASFQECTFTCLKPPGLRHRSCKCRSQSIVHAPLSSSFSGKDRNKSKEKAGYTFWLTSWNIISHFSHQPGYSNLSLKIIFPPQKDGYTPLNRHVGFCEGVPIPPRYSDLVDQFGIFYRCHMFSIGWCLNVPIHQILAEWSSASKNSLFKLLPECLQKPLWILAGLKPLDQDLMTRMFKCVHKHPQTFTASFNGLFILWALIYDSAFNAGFLICLLNFSGTTTSCKPELFHNCFVTAAAEWNPLCVNL